MRSRTGGFSGKKAAVLLAKAIACYRLVGTIHNGGAATLVSMDHSLKASGVRDAFGCQVAHLEDDRQIATNTIRFHRKFGSTPPGQVVAPATGNGYLIGLSSSEGHRRTIFREHHAEVYDFKQNALYLRRSSEDYKADLSGTFDFLLMEISSSHLTEIADHADVPGVTELVQITAEPDPLLGGMMQALFAAHMANPHLRQLFIDQMTAAIGTHIVHTYGNGRRAATNPPSLSSTELERVKDLMRSGLRDGVSLDELASACAMSRAGFVRAFRSATGKTPDAWMASTRLEEACFYLRHPDMPLVEIAAICGFRNIEHFRRAFILSKGVSPEAWCNTVMA